MTLRAEVTAKNGQVDLKGAWHPENFTEQHTNPGLQTLLHIKECILFRSQLLNISIRYCQIQSWLIICAGSFHSFRSCPFFSNPISTPPQPPSSLTSNPEKECRPARQSDPRLPQSKQLSISEGKSGIMNQQSLFTFLKRFLRIYSEENSKICTQIMVFRSCPNSST